MPDSGPRPRGRVRTRTLLLGGGAVAVIAAAIALGGAGTSRPGSQQDSSPRTADTLRDVTGRDVATYSLPWHKSSISATSAAPVSLILLHGRTEERDEVRGGTKQMGAARNRAHINEPHDRHQRLRPRPPADPAPNRHAPQPSPRAKRTPSDPRPPSPDTSTRGRSQSLIAMKCDELFPPHKREFQLRNIACHRLLG